MTAQSAIRWGMAYGIAALAVACSDPKSSPGRDEETRSTATTVT